MWNTSGSLVHQSTSMLPNMHGKIYIQQMSWEYLWGTMINLKTKLDLVKIVPNIGGTSRKSSSGEKLHSSTNY